MAEAYWEVRLHYELDMKKAMEDADLIIESLSEDPKAKIAFYQSMAEVLPEKTVVVTNSSTMLPSTFAPYTGRPDKYLALHFANEIWKNNTAEIMGHSETNQKYYDEVVEFAQQIGMIPLKLKKEQPGYILNSLLVPFLNAGQALVANGVADPETIDLTWMLGTGAPLGPFIRTIQGGHLGCYRHGRMLYKKYSINIKLLEILGEICILYYRIAYAIMPIGRTI